MRGVDMNDKKIFEILNELFFNFEENIFINDGVWSKKANLIFAFSDYIENFTDTQIAEYLKTNDLRLIERFRFIARQGIEKWLNDNMKTLMI